MTKLTILTFIAIILFGCGDNLGTPDATIVDAAPPDARRDTWADAERVWSDAWCLYAARCYPSQFTEHYTPMAIKTDDTLHDTCVRVETQNLCSSPYELHACTEDFPEDLLPGLQRCHDEMSDIACEATMAPDVCYAVWGS